MIFELVKERSLANHFIAELRDVKIQEDRMRFRKNLERLGEIMSYELSKKLEYEEVNITTPLGEKKTTLLKNQPILVPILRAGIPFYQGVLNYFDRAGSGFIAAWRVEEEDSGKLPEIELSYIAAPSIEGGTIIMVDPMLATGKSLVLATNQLLKHGTPKHIHIMSVIAARPGVEHVEKNIPKDHTIWVGEIDEELNSKSYIVPGLGDAGDLSFGPKL